MTVRRMLRKAHLCEDGWLTVPAEPKAGAQLEPGEGRPVPMDFSALPSGVYRIAVDVEGSAFQQ